MTLTEEDLAIALGEHQRAVAGYHVAIVNVFGEEPVEMGQDRVQLGPALADRARQTSLEVFRPEDIFW
jgi:hypothetical protein